jgi:hypothetical protein
LSITATTSPHASGAVDVVVTNPDGTSATLAATNLLRNSGFEQGTAAWSFSGTGAASVLNLAGRAHGGAFYAELTSAPGRHPVFSPLTSTGATAYDGYARLALALFDGNKANPTYFATSPNTVNSAVWTLQKSTYTVPAGKAYVRAYLEIYKNTTSSVARFDDITVSTGGFTYK